MDITGSNTLTEGATVKPTEIADVASFRPVVEAGAERDEITTREALTPSVAASEFKIAVEIFRYCAEAGEVKKVVLNLPKTLMDAAVGQEEPSPLHLPQASTVP